MSESRKYPGGCANTWNAYGDTLRKVHITYATPFVFENVGKGFDAPEWVRLLNDANVKTVIIYMKDHHGRCYYKTTVGKVSDVDILGALLPETKKAGIELHAYFSIPDQYVLGMHPDWRTTDYSGQAAEWAQNVQGTPCLISSPYREFAWQQIEDLVSGYDVDGVWPDVGWISHEMKACYCPHCRKKFRHQFGEELSADLSPKALSFIEAEQNGFFEEAERIIKKHRPAALTGGTHGYDMLSLESHAPYLEGQDMIGRYGRARRIPVEITSPGSVSGWHGFDSKPASLLKVEVAGALAHGANLLVGLAPHNDGGVEPGSFATVKQVFSHVKAVEPVCTRPDSVSDVAVRYEEDIQLSIQNAPFRTSPSEFTGVHHTLLEDHIQYDFVLDDKPLPPYSLLIIPDQAVGDRKTVERISDYVRGGGNLLVTGAGSLLDGCTELQELLGVRPVRGGQMEFAYARLGGAISRHLPDVPLLIGKPIEMEPVGAEVIAHFSYPEAAYNSLVCSWITLPKPARDAALLPLITRNRVGTGSCVYVGFGIGSACQSALVQAPFGHVAPWQEHVAVSAQKPNYPHRSRTAYESVLHKRLLKNIVSMLVPDKVVTTNAPAGVKVVLNRKDDRYVIHMVNQHIASVYGMSDGVNNLTLKGLSVEVDAGRTVTPRRVYTVPGEVDLPFESLDGRTRIAVNDFDVSTIIVVE